MSKNSSTARHRNTLSIALLSSIASLWLIGSVEAGTGIEDVQKEQKGATLQESNENEESQGAASNHPGGLDPLDLWRPGGTTVNKWLGSGAHSVLTVDQVMVGETNIGRLDFLSHANYTNWEGTGNRDYGGTAIVGGFTSNGSSPCEGGVYKPGTQFKWIQLIFTTHPLTGQPTNEFYVDTKKDPLISPWYPNGTRFGNTAGKAFTGTAPDGKNGFYDSSCREEPATGTACWLATNYLVCTNGGRKINVIGKFDWGWQMSADDEGTLNDGEVDIFALTPEWSSSPSDGLMKILSDELRSDDPKREGWAVSRGSCCPEPKTTDATSGADGIGEIRIEVPEGETLEGVCIFPRNQEFDWEMAGTITDWYLEPSDFFGVPLLDWQDEPSEMFQDGAYYWPQESIIGPAEVTIMVPLTGHESFLDLYLLDSDFEWTPAVQRTDHLLGDMNGDGSFSDEDVSLLELAINDADAYAELYPWINPVFAGDFLHDGSTDTYDLAELIELVNDVDQESDSHEEGIECPADINGDGQIAINDLLAVIGAWGACDGCDEDFNNDGTVDVHELLSVIEGWGACSDA